MIPVYINVRDRVTDLRKLVAWLERAGREHIVLLDNASTYEPLLDYLSQTPHEVIRLGRNYGSRALWNADLTPGEWFVYTDPDVVPIEDCPPDAIDHLRDALERFGPGHTKAALGLYLADLPPTMPSFEWECSLVSADREIAPGLYGSLVDTTFAVYRPGEGFAYEGIRCGWPYQARHTSWYVTEPGEEDRYYLEHAEAGPLGSSWKEAVWPSVHARSRTSSRTQTALPPRDPSPSR